MPNPRRKSPDLILFLSTLALLIIGIVMVFSASSVKSYAELGDAYYYLKRQLMWSVIGVSAMLFMMNFDYRLLKKLALPAFIVVLIMLAVVPIPGVGKLVGGARRWLGVGIWQIQPSELCKFIMIALLSAILSAKPEKNKNFWHGIAIPCGIMAVVFGLIMAEPDLGTAGSIAATTIVLTFTAGANPLYLGGLASAGIPAVIYMIWTEPYRLKRVTAFLNPWADPLRTGFHACQSLLALGSGGLFGVGLGRSRQKYYYLPEQHTDFIFAILGEELGLLGAMLVLGLFFLFAWRGYRTAIACQDPFGSLLAVGITTQILVQAVINIGVVSGSLPVTGITLPLISYGGSSLCITLAGIGILLNISKQVLR